MIESAEEAKKIISMHGNDCACRNQSYIRDCGFYEAKAYLSALEGIEVEALVEALEFYSNPEKSFTEEPLGKCASEALALYEKAVKP